MYKMDSETSRINTSSISNWKSKGIALYLSIIFAQKNRYKDMAEAYKFMKTPPKTQTETETALTRIQRADLEVAIYLYN